EGRRLLDCDRLTVLTCRGRRCRVEAVSGQDVFDRRSNVVRQLEHLAECAVKTREPLWHTGEILRCAQNDGAGAQNDGAAAWNDGAAARNDGAAAPEHVTASLRDADASLGETRPRDDLPTQLEEALDAFLDESHSRQVVVLPLLPAAKARTDAADASEQ